MRAPSAAGGPAAAGALAVVQLARRPAREGAHECAVRLADALPFQHRDGFLQRLLRFAACNRSTPQFRRLQTTWFTQAGLRRPVHPGSAHNLRVLRRTQQTATARCRIPASTACQLVWHVKAALQGSVCTRLGCDVGRQRLARQAPANAHQHAAAHSAHQRQTQEDACGPRSNPAMCTGHLKAQAANA